MKRTPLSRGTKQLKRTPLKKKSKNPIPKLKEKLWELTTNYVKLRDSRPDKTEQYEGYCCSCGELCSGQRAQGGHYRPDAASGAWLRYHPHNVHLQCRSCNVAMSQQQAERSKVGYASFMYKKYGIEYVEALMNMGSSKSIKADIIFYQNMIDLYSVGNEEGIINYLNSL